MQVLLCAPKRHCANSSTDALAIQSNCPQITPSTPNKGRVGWAEQSHAQRLHMFQSLDVGVRRLTQPTHKFLYVIGVLVCTSFFPARLVLQLSGKSLKEIFPYKDAQDAKLQKSG